MHGRTRAHASASLRQRYCGIGSAEVPKNGYIFMSSPLNSALPM